MTEHDNGDWVVSALCRQVDPDLWFPEQGGGGAAHVKMVKKICRECPVRQECLDLGLDERYGIWGGYSERERRYMRKGFVVGSPLPRGRWSA